MSPLMATECLDHHQNPVLSPAIRPFVYADRLGIRSRRQGAFGTVSLQGLSDLSQAFTGSAVETWSGTALSTAAGSASRGYQLSDNNDNRE